jgi:hypothetical protein
MNSSMRFLGKKRLSAEGIANMNEGFELRKEIMALTKDIKNELILAFADEDPSLSGQALHDEVEQLFNENYRMAKDVEFLMRREGMEFLYEEEKGEFATLFYQVTPLALSSLNVIFNESNKRLYQKKYIDEGYLPNGEGPVNRLFTITLSKQSFFHIALTTNDRYPVFLRPYKVLLQKRVRLGELLSEAGGQSYLMDKLLGKNKLRKSRSRKLRSCKLRSRSRKVRHSRSRK